LLQLVSRAARAVAAAVPGSVVLVGDVSSERGGPLSGHASHQAGRDADIAFMVSDSQGAPVVLDTFEPFGADGHSLVNPQHFFDAYRNWVMLRTWLSDLRVVTSHVFVAGELRQLLLDYGRQSPEFARYVPLAAGVLHPHPAHTDHFHLRIACPTERDSQSIDQGG
jgi:penicillin-insensitive murein endopeptidase